MRDYTIFSSMILHNRYNIFQEMSFIMRFLEKTKSSKGEPISIAMLFVVLVIVVIIATVLDLGLFFNNQNIINTNLQNGARTVAIMGGTNSPISSNIMPGQASAGVIAAPPASNQPNPIGAAHAGGATFNIQGDAMNLARGGQAGAVERLIVANFAEQDAAGMFTGARLRAVRCGPDQVSSALGVGQRTWCSASWRHHGVPLSLFSMFSSNQWRVSSMTAQSEVWW
jgi:hypothetical protein